ncbi:anti-sigma factor family protein [Meridianimarinicoccus sp. RP-17]|uniref:anti-sigma factor family protein n=1 Tax=Meridianimarinicoccus zhengii TaxID=2056810 RepID=UPI000DAD9A33|nr:hypothetical protein [Phycocomes zhengii]
MTERLEIDELDLLALADGVFDDDPARKAELESAVADSPRAAAQLADYRAQTAALRAAYAGVLAEPVPERHYAALDGADKGRARPMMRRAAAGLLIVAAGMGGWLIGNGDDDPIRQALLDESYRQFQLHGSNEANAASTVAAGSAINWADEGVAMRLSAPDLSSQGFTIVEKRGVRIGKDQIVALKYMSQDGRAFSLFLTPRWANRPGPIVEQERDGVALAYWHDGPLASSIATTLPQDQARHLARTVRDAMREDAATPPAILEPDPRLLRNPAAGVMADTLGSQPGPGASAPGEGPQPASVTPN